MGMNGTFYANSKESQVAQDKGRMNERRRKGRAIADMAVVTISAFVHDFLEKGMVKIQNLRA